MYAVILAGGFGTRLKRVLNGNTPKPLVPIKGRPFLEFVINNLKQMGFRRFVFCLYYLAEKIQDYFGNGADYGIKIEYSIEEQPLGTGGAVGPLRGKLKSTFCVVNADTYLELNMMNYLYTHQLKNATATIALAEAEDTSRYGQVNINGDGKILNFLEKEDSGGCAGYINAGFYLLEPRIFTYIPEGRFVSLEKDVFPKMISEGEKIYSYKGVANFFDIGTPEDYYKFLNWVK